MEGFSESVIRGIDSVTRRGKKPNQEPYEDFVLRAGRDPIGRTVKLADLEDNSDFGRIANPTDDDRKRVDKYRRAIELLRGQVR